MLKMHELMPILVEVHTNFVYGIKFGALIGRAQLTVIVRFFSVCSERVFILPLLLVFRFS